MCSYNVEAKVLQYVLREAACVVHNQSQEVERIKMCTLRCQHNIWVRVIVLLWQISSNQQQPSSSWLQ